MKQNLKKIRDFSLQDRERNKGRIKDFILEEDKWVIRYFEVDLGKDFLGRKVLISTQFVELADWESNNFQINKTKNEILHSPKLDDNLTVSRKYEEELNKHYKLLNYWDLPLPSMQFVPYTFTRQVKIPDKKIREKDLDTNLRSFNEVTGYHIHAENGKIGQVIDFIIDTENWQIVYLVIDTSNWIPWSKKVVIPITLLAEISYTNQEATVDLPVEIIKNSPEYKEDMPIAADYEEKLHNYYNENWFVKV